MWVCFYFVNVDLRLVQNREFLVAFNNNNNTVVVIELLLVMIIIIRKDKKKKKIIIIIIIIITGVCASVCIEKIRLQTLFYLALLNLTYK